MALSDNKKAKIEEDLNELESEIKDGKNYLIISPQIGVGLRFQHQSLSVRLAAVYSPFPGSSEYGIHLRSVGLETGVEMQMGK